MQDKTHFANESTLGMIYDEVCGNGGSAESEELLKILLELGLAREERLRKIETGKKQAM